MRHKMHLLSLEGHRFGGFFSMRKVGTTKGTNLRVNALFRYECAPSSRNLPTLCMLHKTVPHYKGKIMIHWDNFPGSTPPITALCEGL